METPISSLSALFAESGVDPFRCVQCGRCSSGCPTAFETGHSPRRIMRYLQWGWVEEAVRSPFPWACVSCQACTTRCPRGLDIAGTMFALRRHALARGLMQSDRAGHFCAAYMDLARKNHRVSELLLGMRMLRSSGVGWEDIRLSLQLLRRGRLNLTAWQRTLRNRRAEDHG